MFPSNDSPLKRERAYNKYSFVSPQQQQQQQLMSQNGSKYLLNKPGAMMYSREMPQQQPQALLMQNSSSNINYFVHQPKPLFAAGYPQNEEITYHPHTVSPKMATKPSPITNFNVNNHNFHLQQQQQQELQQQQQQLQHQQQMAFKTPHTLKQVQQSNSNSQLSSFPIQKATASVGFVEQQQFQNKYTTAAAAFDDSQKMMNPFLQKYSRPDYQNPTHVRKLSFNNNNKSNDELTKSNKIASPPSQQQVAQYQTTDNDYSDDEYDYSEDDVYDEDDDYEDSDEAYGFMMKTAAKNGDGSPVGKVRITKHLNESFHGSQMSLNNDDEYSQMNAGQNGNNSDDSSDKMMSMNGQRKRHKGELICQVCGANANGYNFDAITCESCKAFFRRNAFRSKSEFRCINNTRCVITVNTRKKCKRCRIEKCFGVGMRKEWIMSETEREEKRRKIEENRRKKAIKIHSQVLHSPGEGYYNGMHHGAYGDGVSSSRMSFVESAFMRNNNDEEKNHHSNMLIDKPIRRRRRRRRRGVNPMEETHGLMQQQQEPHHSPSMHDQNHDFSYLPPIRKQQQQQQQQQSNEKLYSLKAFQEFCDSPIARMYQQQAPSALHLSLNKLPSGEDANSQQYKHNRSLSSSSLPSSAISPNMSEKAIHIDQSEISESVYNSSEYTDSSDEDEASATRRKHQKIEQQLTQFTPDERELIKQIDENYAIAVARNVPGGDDLPGSLAGDVNNTINVTEMAVRRLIGFFKLNSDFRSLTQNTQTIILKGCMMELLLIHSAIAYDPKKNIFHEPSSKSKRKPFSIDSIKETYGEEKFERIMDITESLKQLCEDDFTMIKIMFFLALFKLENDGVTPSQQDLLRQFQMKYSKLLLKFMRNRFGYYKGDVKFGQFACRMRQINALGTDFRHIVVEASNPDRVNGLMREVFLYSSGKNNKEQDDCKIIETPATENNNNSSSTINANR